MRPFSSCLLAPLAFFVAAACVQGPLCSAAAAATRWVATTGNDTTGDGSSSRPWATITHALDTCNDGDLVLVRPGTYVGRVDLRGTFATGVVVRSEIPYLARLRRNSTVVVCYYGQGITLAGFDIAHLDSAGPVVVQIQDLRGAPGGTDRTSRITLRDNVIHDSRDNDLVKINNGATQITVAGNLFYNQTGHDEHLDVNGVSDVVVEDNVFFNDFAGSGRPNANDTGSYVVVKDSNAGADGELGSARITIRRNVFLHWEGSAGSNFVLLGEDGQPFHEAYDVIVENNLFLGDSPNVLRAPVGVKGGRDIVFRSNTMHGNMPANAFAMRLNVEGMNPPNSGIAFYANAWSDPTATMQDFSDTAPGETTSFVLNRNAYWNGGAVLPTSATDLVNPDDDPQPRVGDPRLPSLAGLVLPRWTEATARFADGSLAIRQVFVSLVERYGVPAAGSVLIDAGTTATAATDDILGRLRGPTPDLGAYEVGSVTDVEPPAPAGSRVQLQALSPNPFRTELRLQLAVQQRTAVEVEVLDVAGRRVRSLLRTELTTGIHTVGWDGRDDRGRAVPTGVYLVRLRTAAGEDLIAKCVRSR